MSEFWLCWITGAAVGGVVMFLVMLVVLILVVRDEREGRQ